MLVECNRIAFVAAVVAVANTSTCYVYSFVWPAAQSIYGWAWIACIRIVSRSHPLCTSFVTIVEVARRSTYSERIHNEIRIVAQQMHFHSTSPPHGHIKNIYNNKINEIVAPNETSGEKGRRRWWRWSKKERKKIANYKTHGAQKPNERIENIECAAAAPATIEYIYQKFLFLSEIYNFCGCLFNCIYYCYCCCCCCNSRALISL